MVELQTGRAAQRCLSHLQGAGIQGTGSYPGALIPINFNNWLAQANKDAHKKPLTHIHIHLHRCPWHFEFGIYWL